MRSEIFAVITLMVTTISAVEEKPPSAESFCPDFKRLVSEIMSAKQSGIAEHSVIEVLIKSTPEESREVILVIIREAYSLPDQHSETLQNEQRETFTKRWENICYEALKGEKT